MSSCLRLLLTDEGDENANPYTSLGYILWYCALFLCCGVPMMCCAICFTSYSCRVRHEPFQHEEIDQELARIEANVAAFSAYQSDQRRKLLIRTLKDHILTINASHLERKQTDDDVEEQKNEIAYTQLSQGCPICLTRYEVGDAVVRSTNNACHHMFHQGCIMDWLAMENTSLCPCCRQLYVLEMVEICKQEHAGGSSIISSSESERGRGDSAPQRNEEERPAPVCDEETLDSRSIDGAALHL